MILDVAYNYKTALGSLLSSSSIVPVKKVCYWTPKRKNWPSLIELRADVLGQVVYPVKTRRENKILPSTCFRIRFGFIDDFMVNKKPRPQNITQTSTYVSYACISGETSYNIKQISSIGYLTFAISCLLHSRQTANKFRIGL